VGTFSDKAPPARKARGVHTRSAITFEGEPQAECSEGESTEAGVGNTVATHRARRREPRGPG